MVAPQIFINSEQQSLFDKQGFIVVPNFLNKEEVQYMDNYFDELHPNLPVSGFFAGSYSADLDYKKKVSEKIKTVYNRAYEKIFQNYTAFGGAYLFKISSPNSDLFVHQDWTVVDESKEIALNIWVPLCDITIDNGPLMVLPGSHYSNFPTLRAPTMNYFFDHDFEKVIEQLEPVIVKAGDAVILNQSLVHYSPPNISGKIRKAITAGIKTKDAQMIFHYKNKELNNGKIEKFLMDDDFFIQFEDFFKDIFKRPKVGKSLGLIDYEVPIIKGKQLESLVKKMKESSGFKYKEIEKEKPKLELVNEKKIENNFWEVYTPLNILREIKFKITGK